jgi:exosortase
LPLDDDKEDVCTLTIRLTSLQRLASLKNLSNLVLALKASTVIIAVATVYFQDLVMIFTDALTNESTSYILIIPLLLAYLIYRKRKMFRSEMLVEEENYHRSAKYLGTLCGILLCATAIILYWYGSYTFTPLEYHALSLPIFTAGLTVVLFNPQTLRQAAFPIAFLAFLAPLPSEFIYGLGSTLSVISSEASNAIVNVLGIRSTISNLLGTPAIIITQADSTVLPPFTVDIACSGIYSLIGFLVFAAFVAFIVRDKLWKKAAIFLVGFPLIYFLNILRITIILLIGYQWGEQLALSMFHLLGGWILIFLGTLILLLISERFFRTRIFTKKLAQHGCSDCDPTPSDQTENFCSACGRLIKYPQIGFRKADAAKIATVALIAILLISIQVPVFALTQGPAQIINQTPTGQEDKSQIFPERIQNCTLQYVQRDTEFENLSGQDLSLMYAYVPQNMERETVYVGLEIASTRAPLHNWEYCLVTWLQTRGYQPTVEQLDLRDVQIMQNPSIIARYFAFKDRSNNLTQLVLYWYENSIFTTNGTSQQKYVKISLIVYPNTPQDLTRMETELLPFATTIVNFWQPIRTWTAIAIALSSNGITLAEITLALLAAIIIFYTYKTIEQRKVNAKTYQKLSPQNKQIIDTITEAEKTTKPTLEAIADTYKIKTALQIEKEELLQKLSETKKTGIAKNAIANIQDEPTRIWKIEMTRKSHEHRRLDRWKQIITSRLK